MVYGSVAECIGVYFAAGDRFLTETNISQANPATTIHFGKKHYRMYCQESPVGQVDVFGVVLMNSIVGKEQVTLAMAALISKQRETYKPITCLHQVSEQCFSIVQTEKELMFHCQDTEDKQNIVEHCGEMFQCQGGRMLGVE